MRFTSTVEGWFKDELGGTLLLPDGWYGRPYDNQHSLTSIDEADDTLTIILDHKLTLRFDGLESVKVQGRDLIFGPFAKLRFDWEGFGNDGSRGTKEYRTGDVKIVR